MALEIERKYLVEGDFLPLITGAVRITQGYINMDPASTVRVRIQGDNQAFLTVKGISSEDGLIRPEFDYPIPYSDGVEMLKLPIPTLSKVRYSVPHEGRVFEVDVFLGLNRGLVLAELEFNSPVHGSLIDLPDWIGEEVTGDKRYYNSQLVTTPYSRW